jgi:hypothetical protein
VCLGCEQPSIFTDTLDMRPMTVNEVNAAAEEIVKALMLIRIYKVLKR